MFGERPQLPSPSTDRRADAGDARLHFAAMKHQLPMVTPQPATVMLPKTATDAELKMIAGLILLALSLMLLVFSRRQTFAR